MIKHRKKILPILVGILWVHLSMAAQIRESATILGNITDEQGLSLPGAAVTVESPNLIGGPQSFLTGADGFYKFRALSVGTYKVTAKLAGFNILVKEGLELHAGMTLTADFKMTQAKVAAEVIVEADIPTIDTKSSQPKPIILTDEFLINLPGKASWSGIASLAPGVSQTYSSQAFGWQHDGIDSSYAFNGMSGFAPDVRIIKEAAVLSLGLPAEYGEFTGAVLSTVSKSGSNRFSTFNEFRYRGKKWNSQNAGRPPKEEWYSAGMATQVYATNPYFDIGSQFGGKIIHDRLWFFLAGEYDNGKTPITGLDKNRASLATKAFGKLTYQLSTANRINLAVSRNLYENTNYAISVTNPDIGYDNETESVNGNLNWTSMFSSTTFLDVKLGYNYYIGRAMPHGGLDTPGIYDRFTYRYINNYTDATATSSRTSQISAHISHYIPEFLKGSHDLKAGAEFVHYKILWDRKAPGDRIEYYSNGVPVQAEDRLPWYQDTYNNTIIAFAQDRWSLTKRLTFNLGVRMDSYRFYFPAESSTQGTIYHNTAFAPRLGITYDLLGDRKNIVKLNYSHYYNGISRTGWVGSFEHRYAGGAKYNWDAASQKWIMTSSPSDTAAVKIPQESNASQPWLWELSGGYERELFRDASLTVNFWWRQLGNILDALYYDATFAPWTTTNPGPDGKVGTADDMGPITLFTLVSRGVERRLMNPQKGSPAWLTEDLQYKSRAVEIRFTKKFSKRWQMMASYMYHRIDGNTDGAYSNTFIDPNRIFNSYGHRGYNEPHQFMLQTNVLLPFDINLTGMYSLMSGRYLDQTISLYPPSYLYYVPYRVHPPGAGEKADPVSNLDLKLEKQIRYKGATLAIGLDVSNAANNYGGSGELSSTFGTTYLKRTYIKAPRIYTANIRIIY